MLCYAMLCYAVCVCVCVCVSCVVSIHSLILSLSLSIYLSPNSWSEVWDNNSNRNDGQQQEEAADDNKEEDEESDQWYYNVVPPFGANVAYSLYGVLKEQGEEESNEQQQKQKAGCQRGTYINSFVTTGGMQTFTGTLGMLGLEDFGKVANANDGDEQQEQDDDDNSDNTAAIEWSQLTSTCSVYNNNNNENTNSYALACSTTPTARWKKGGYSFAMAEFEGSSCYGPKAVQVINPLDDFNQALTNQVTCVELYNAETSSNSNGNNNNNNNGEQEQQEENEYYAPYKWLLQNSRACSSRDDGTTCPDPYGKRLAYQRALDQATHAIYQTSNSIHWKRIMSWCMMTIGLACFVATVIMSIRTCCHSYQKYRQRKRKRRQQKLLGRRSNQKQQRGPPVGSEESTQVEAEYCEPSGQNDDTDYDFTTDGYYAAVLETGSNGNNNKYEDDEDLSLPASISNEITISQNDSFIRNVSLLTTATNMTRDTTAAAANAQSSPSSPARVADKTRTKPTGKFTRWLRRGRLFGRK